MGTIIVLAIVLVMVYFAARSVIRNKKAGKCSGGCAGCSGSCTCGQREKSDQQCIPDKAGRSHPYEETSCGQGNAVADELLSAIQCLNDTGS